MKRYCRTLSVCVLCDDCHTSRTYVEEDEYETNYYCANGDEDRNIPDGVAEGGFPEFCPLPDSS